MVTQRRNIARAYDFGFETPAGAAVLAPAGSSLASCLALPPPEQRQTDATRGQRSAGRDADDQPLAHRRVAVGHRAIAGVRRAADVAVRLVAVLRPVQLVEPRIEGERRRRGADGHDYRGDDPNDDKTLSFHCTSHSFLLASLNMYQSPTG